MSKIIKRACYSIKMSVVCDLGGMLICIVCDLTRMLEWCLCNLLHTSFGSLNFAGSYILVSYSFHCTFIRP